eukprot:CAMPEP_0204522176 /NCGR_PEP_ID=MMETSP0661-20131031/6178_1 /ASSEMBLY_ACC=CAM_ASM_000606 /TAXON_ID=109239 /ORGANISM="Alexandrium margalefi, Strain AMGDE01CS-322" /LENGTH=126 /DNA_ID=CAMNT_0051527819 /DNA_START=76 /DNA_END=453 /DNA_ORIENTATION=+
MTTFLIPLDVGSWSLAWLGRTGTPQQVQKSLQVVVLGHVAAVQEDGRASAPLSACFACFPASPPRLLACFAVLCNRGGAIVGASSLLRPHQLPAVKSTADDLHVHAELARFQCSSSAPDERRYVFV